MRPSGSGFLIFERLLITVSVPLLVIGVFRFSVSSGFNPGMLWESKN